MNAADAITVLARWQPAPNAMAEVLALAEEMRERSLAEPGCLGYEIYRSPAAPDAVLLVERYRDAAALEKHKQSAHYQLLVTGQVLPLLAYRKVDLLRACTPA